MKIHLRILATTLLTCLLANAVFAQEAPSAKAALEKLKTLAGSWKGEIMRIPITFTIRSVSSGTAIVHEGHTESGGPPNHEITMFYVDGDRLLSTHYCDAGNRSNLEGKMSPDGKTIKFNFIEVIGSKRGGYVKDMAFTLADANNHVVEITFITPDGKTVPLRGEFKRVKQPTWGEQLNKALSTSCFPVKSQSETHA